MTDNQTYADLRQLGHEWAADKLQALTMLRQTGSRGVDPASLPGFPAVLTALGEAGYPTYSTGRGPGMRVTLTAQSPQQEAGQNHTSSQLSIGGSS